MNSIIMGVSFAKHEYRRRLAMYIGSSEPLVIRHDTCCSICRFSKEDKQTEIKKNES